VKGEIDLGVIVWVKDIYEFYNYWDRTLDRFEKYFDKYAISIYLQSSVFKKSYLLSNENSNRNEELFSMRCGGSSIEIDEVDYHLLNELAVNGRMPLIDLAEKLDCSSQKISYRIKNLVKSGVIRAFRVDIDLSKLNLQRYKVDIYLKDHNLKKPINSYLSDKDYIEFMNFAIGWADLEPEFIVRNFDELLTILGEINSRFSGAIKKQSFFIIDKIYKLRCLPEIY
jgi:DNA-binding Lrp family transcriptional regulator